MDIQKPILKWVGGKTQLLSIILEKNTANHDNHL